MPATPRDARGEDDPSMADPAARPETTAPAVLSVHELECRRGDRVLFAPISFVVGSGSIVWLRGANGQGKTTLLRTVAGLSAPSAGTIEWADASALAAPPLYLAHANALKDDLTVAESLRFLLHLGGGRADARDVDAAIERFGMASRRNAFVRTLSQGQRRRVALARLAAERDLRPWLLDEPFDALDADGVELLAGVIAQHAQRGGCVVLTSHLPLTITDPAPVVVQLRELALA
jgi:heme exporter protein A